MSGSSYGRRGSGYLHKKASNSQVPNHNHQLNQSAQFYQESEETRIRNALRIEACQKQRSENEAREQADHHPPKPLRLGLGPSGGFATPNTDLTDKVKASLADLRAKREQDPSFKPQKILPVNPYFVKPSSSNSNIVVDQIYDYSGLISNESLIIPITAQDTETAGATLPASRPIRSRLSHSTSSEFSVGGSSLSHVADGDLSDDFMEEINKFAIRGEDHFETSPSAPASPEEDVKILQPAPETSPAVIDLIYDDSYKLPDQLRDLTSSGEFPSSSSLAETAVKKKSVANARPKKTSPRVEGNVEPDGENFANLGTMNGQGQSPYGTEAASNSEYPLPPTKSSTSKTRGKPQSAVPLKPTEANLKRLQKKLLNIDNDVENLRQKLNDKQNLRDKIANEVKEMNQTLSSSSRASTSTSSQAKRKFGSPEESTKKKSTKPLAFDDQPRKKETD